MISDAVPGARLRLLGTYGELKTEEAVRNAFRKRNRGSLEIHTQFRPEDLPRLLADCWVGVFPSLLEGFPLGVLEMLAASVPVIAYDAPGAPEMIAPENLVKPRDWLAMAKRVVSLLREPDHLLQQRLSAAQGARKYTWANAAAIVEREYLVWCDIIRSRGPAPQSPKLLPNK